ncbi:hypothetical protein JCM10213v2_000790 [Rhodosporidiobolus nylandii]
MIVGGQLYQPPAAARRFPLALPEPPPFRPLDLSGLSLDDHLSEVPVEFVQKALAELGPAMLRSALETTILDKQPPNLCERPVLACHPPPPPLPHPTFALSIQFLDTQEHHHLPIHGMVYAFASPLFSSLSRAPTIQDNSSDSLFLPVVHLTLPSQAAWPLLHDYLYTLSTARLLSDLLTSPSPSPPPSSPLRSSPMHEQLESIVLRLRQVQQLWLIAAALEVGDAGLWATMRRAWSVLTSEAMEVMGRSAEEKVAAARAAATGVVF